MLQFEDLLKGLANWTADFSRFCFILYLVLNVEDLGWRIKRFSSMVIALHQVPRNCLPFRSNWVHPRFFGRNALFVVACDFSFFFGFICTGWVMFVLFEFLPTLSGLSAFFRSSLSIQMELRITMNAKSWLWKRWHKHTRN